MQHPTDPADGWGGVACSVTRLFDSSKVNVYAMYCTCACVCVHACVRACVCACVRACVCEIMFRGLSLPASIQCVFKPREGKRNLRGIPLMV